MNITELLSAPWAILPESLREIHQIYANHLKGEKADLAAVEARVGHPLANEQQSYTVREGGVAVLTAEGVIAPKANMFTQISGGVSSQLLVKQLQSVGADTRVKSLIQVIDSPGGSVFGIPEWGNAILELSDSKPVVTISDGQLASAAYWGGSAANAVFLTGVTAQAGSIGVYARMGLSSPDPSAIEFVRGKYKRSAINGNAPSPEFMAYYEGYLDHMYSVFVEAVAQHRGTTPELVLQHMADGRLFTGQQAIDAGLVDGFSTVDAMVEKLATNPAAFTKRRKAKVSMAVVTPAPAAPVQQPSPLLSTTSGVHMNRAELAAAHPELLQSLIAEGAAAERTRIQAVQGALIPGHEALVQTMMFDGRTSGGDAALAINAAERQVREKQGAAAVGEAPRPAAQVAAPSVQSTAEAQAAAAAAAEETRLAALPVEERCKAQWEASAQIRGEFSSLAAYTALTKADEAGRVRVLGAKKA